MRGQIVLDLGQRPALLINVFPSNIEGCQVMDFRLSEQQLALQLAASRFATEQLPELAKQLEQTSEPVPRDWLLRYAEMGFLGINVAERYGGSGLGNFEALLVLEEFAKISSAV